MPINTNALTAALLGLCLLTPLAACQMPDEDTDSPRSASENQLVGLRYEITTSGELSKEQIQSLAAFVEAQGEGVSQAKVAVHQDDEGAIASIMVELWGAELPGEELADSLAQEFEFLADAQVAISELGEMEGEGPMVEGPDIEPGDDPDTIRQKVIDDLRAKGVEGEIEVTVTPQGEDGYAVEVEVHDDQG